MTEIATTEKHVDWQKLMSTMESPELYYRRPGRFRRWEVGDIVQAEGDFRAMEESATADGTRLYAIYRRESPDRVHAQAIEALLRHGKQAAPGAIPARAEVGPAPRPERDLPPDNGASVADDQQQMLLFGELPAPPRVARMPGLFTRRELDEILPNHVEYHVDPSGSLEDGTELFAVFLHVRDRRRAAE